MKRTVFTLATVALLTCSLAASAQDSKPADAPSTAAASAPADAKPAEKADAKPAEKADAKPAAVAGANLTVGSMTVDGFTVSELSCRLDGGGFLASATVVGGLAAQKAKIQKCGKKGDKVHVLWSLKGGKTSDVKVTGGSAKAQKCVAKAMKRVKVAIPGQCGGFFHLGK